ncbi:MAG: NAD(P)/FAD-dependent oxidoreductase [Prevotella sp.]|nr:NAD(P)/FAD-dependent oxidoreductase [Prevotella sp.]
MKTAIIGGGAAGFFLAVNLKEMMPEMEITIFERGQRVLRKVAISGGGRCNCTNSFADVRDLSEVYPRGHRLMKRLFNVFDYRDAYEWFERHGVKLMTQDDNCVFPASQDAQSIVGCLLGNARRLGIKIQTGRKITSLDELSDFDFVAVTTGGGISPTLSKGESFTSLNSSTLNGKSIQTPLPLGGGGFIPPCPSLFSFRIDDERLQALMGIVSEATAMIPGTKLKAQGPLLITHWGMSGPAILRLSSYGARMLHDNQYRMPLSVNWTNRKPDEVLTELLSIAATHPQKQVANIRPYGLTGRLWEHLITKALGERSEGKWLSLNKKEINRLSNILTNDEYKIAGRAPFKDEFVTCGGVSLQSINPSTLESKKHPGLYFAGEVLDIDGVTGGFNFQAAWTTAYVVAKSIVSQSMT